MKITALQTDIVWENVKANLTVYEQLLHNLPQTDLIVFPEMFATGFSVSNPHIAENMYGKSVQWLQEIAIEKQAATVASIPIIENRNLFNRLFFCFPNGNYQTYDKQKLFVYSGENQYFTAGQEDLIITYRGWKIKFLICFDLRFPYLSQNHCKNGNYDYDVLIYIANFPQSRSYHFKHLLIARAIENQAYVLGVNRIGKDGNNIAHNGLSMAVDFQGNILTQAQENQTQFLDLLLDKKSLQEYRIKFPFLED